MYPLIHILFDRTVVSGPMQTCGNLEKVDLISGCGPSSDRTMMTGVDCESEADLQPATQPL